MAKKTYSETTEWTQKTTGEDYNNRIDYYATVDLNWNMYNDRQWVGINSKELPKLTMNICKQSVDYLIASIMSRPIKAEYNADNITEPPPPEKDPQTGQPKPEPPEYERDRKLRSIISKLTKAADMKWEKEKMPAKLRQWLLDAAMSGDMCAHVYWSGDNFKTEVIDGANVMFGNPNLNEVEKQPYIILVGRDTVSNLKAEAKKNKVSSDEIEHITSDEEIEYQIGERGKIELDTQDDETKKATYVIKYWRDNDTGNIFWNKSTKNCVIQKKVDTGLTVYPIAWANWSHVKNSYHGNSAIGGIIDNQISINQMFAMIVYWMRMQAFGKVIVDSSRIPKGSWNNKVGQVIYADGNVNDLVKQLEAGNFNSAILSVIELATKYTKDFVGANEAALGQVNPEQASGTAIMMTAKQAAIPHANILENLSQFVEDIYLIWGEFFQRKYPERDMFYRNDNKKVRKFKFDKEEIEDVLLSCKVNVGPSTIWSEPMLMENLTNLLKMGMVNKPQYFERIKEMNIIPDVQGLIADAKLEEMRAQRNKDLELQIQTFLQTGEIPQQWAEIGKGKQTQQLVSTTNNPELQGYLGGMAQNNLRTSQPKQG